MECTYDLYIALSILLDLATPLLSSIESIHTPWFELKTPQLAMFIEQLLHDTANLIIRMVRPSQCVLELPMTSNGITPHV